MSYIKHLITRKLKVSINFQELLKDSVYYPASGIGGRGIEKLGKYSNSFIHADYSCNKEKVTESMEKDFENLGYKTVGVRSVNVKHFDFNGAGILNFPKQKSEIERGKFLNNAIAKLPVFALLAVYQYEGDVPRDLQNFSILHIGGEACDVLEKLYFRNKINPKGIAIFNPSEGYGDNWTMFRDTNYRFYQTLLANCQQQGAQMPEYLATNMTSQKECFWPNYQHINSGKTWTNGSLVEADVFQFNATPSNNQTELDL